MAAYRDDRTREHLVEKLGREQYLIFLAMATIDTINSLNAYAALKHAEAHETVSRLAGEPLSEADRRYVDAVLMRYQDACLSAVRSTHDALLREIGEGPTGPGEPRTELRDSLARWKEVTAEIVIAARHEGEKNADLANAIRWTEAAITRCKRFVATLKAE